MDAQEAVAQLKASRDLGQRLGAAAGAVGAQGLTGHADGQALQRLTQAIDPGQDGHDASATVPDDGRAGAGQPVSAFAEPVIVLDSASAMLAASGASTQLYAAQSLSMTAQGDLQQTAAHTYAQVNGQGASWYAHEGGITAHAANGPVSVRAHADQLQLLAEQGITVCSVNDEIRIFAKDKLSFGAADSGFELNGPDITFTTPGTYQEQGGTHAFLPGARSPAFPRPLPMGVCEEIEAYDEQFHLVDVKGDPLSFRRYRLTGSNGMVWEGTTDAEGLTERIFTSEPVAISIEIYASETQTLVK